MKIKSKVGSLSMQWDIKSVKGVKFDEKTVEFFNLMLNVCNSELNFILWMNIYCNNEFCGYVIEKSELMKKYFKLCNYNDGTNVKNMSVN